MDFSRPGFLMLPILLTSLAFLCVLVNAQTTVVVNGTASHSIPSTLWGQMFEDISHSGDGGLYAELLQNRAFQMVDVSDQATALSAWHSVNEAQLTVIEETIPVSSALPNALSVTIPNGSSSQVGVGNEGYFGIKVDSSETYNASLFYRFPTASSFNGIATVALQTSTGQILGATNVTLSGSQTSWLQVVATIQPTITANALTNNFTVTVDGAALAGQTINFAMFSLFPPTFKNRPNGMRVDIAETLSAMVPSFFRLPGGNNLEGQTVATRWQWNNTVGPLVDRPGRVGDWGYVNTDGVGLFEYLSWCEDLNMQAIMAVWSGFALGGTSIAEDDLGPYIQQAIDQINFAVGDPSESDAAALRASLGHPDPFPVAHIEIGNEDFFAPDTYTYRWNQFSTALQSAFPSLSFLATSDTFNPVLTPNPAEWDIHVYQTPSWFAENSFIYDGFERNGTHYFEGEYAAISTNPNDLFGTPADGRLTFPTMQSSTGEAAFMTGLERNSDIVFAASYAPLLNLWVQHVVNSQWTPNLVSFDSGNVYPSTSYYVQQLFSLNRGDEYLPSTLPDVSGTTFWSVVRNTSVTPNKIIIKVVNTIGIASNITFQLPFAVENTATVQLLTGAETDSNTPTAPNTVAPQSNTITVGDTFTYNAPGFSVSALTLTGST
ncbi:glycoside hydrolase family 51 protein [Lentinula aciculospora]|uniref:non-reducing end alpha-L-arabinofuranosidase n=1 Tax=Lentinula aciculospora TaxID=153920 RepID=A0A9W9AGW5_9AGAR|nr:glycoside hydrolase family 51 protein [Lentinula aciculospora]